jgi:hypothetical protein
MKPNKKGKKKFTTMPTMPTIYMPDIDIPSVFIIHPISSQRWTTSSHTPGIFTDFLECFLDFIFVTRPPGNWLAADGLVYGWESSEHV